MYPWQGTNPIRDFAGRKWGSKKFLLNTPNRFDAAIFDIVED
jgi:hypothetical protein